MIRRYRKKGWKAAGFVLFLAIAGFFLILSTAVSTHALTPEEIEQGGQASEQIQQKTQERLQQQFKEDRKSTSPPTRLEYETPEIKKIEDEVCVQINEIVITDAPNMMEEARAKFISAYKGRCLNIMDIQQLLSDITAYYIKKGYVTTRVYLRQQDLSTGLLEILVVEGRVEKIMLEDGKRNSINIAGAFPFVEGNALNLRDFEQGLDQVNRLASNKATLDIRPGEEPGASEIVIYNEPGRRYGMGMTLDNHGPENTGRAQLGLSVSMDRPLGINDFLSFTYRSSDPLYSGQKMSEMNSLSYILPYGYNTLSLGYSWSSYLNMLQTPGGFELKSNGDSTIGFVRGDRVLYRSQDSIFNMSATLTKKSSRNYLADQLLEVSSRDLAVLDVDLNVTTVLMGGALGLSWGFSKGLDAMDALKDQDNMPDWMPLAQFFKLNYGASYMHPFKVNDYDVQWISTLTGQKSEDVLYGSEQISIGGIYTVRGFIDNTLSGDDGYYLRNDVSVDIPYKKGHIRPYLAIDHGEVFNKVTDVPEGFFTGMALGCSFQGGPVNIDLFTAWPLYTPGFMEKENPYTFVMLSVKI